MAMRVAIIEDDPRFRATLEQLFRRRSELELVDSFPTPLPALRALEQHHPGQTPPWDVVVMDIEMPSMNGIEATRRIKSLDPSIKILVLTVFEHPDTILEAIRAGADGYLLKQSRAAALLEGLTSVAAGGAPLTANVARSVLDLVRSSTTTQTPGRSPSRLDLTDRELDVLRALVGGNTYQQAARALGIELGTVRSHIVSIYKKLQVHSAAEAVGRALREQII